MKKQDFKVLKTKDLYPFPDNPFHVAEDETLSELAESIKEFGIVTPIITRPKDEVQRGKEYSDVFELAARKLGVAPEHCIVFDDVLPAIKSAKAARMLAGGIYDKYSADQRTEIERIADIYLLDFRQAPIPHKEV